jgi:Flp pilus assembly protein TadG
MTRTFFRLRRDTRGAALLEMALTLPMMLMIAAGIFEFGRAYQTWQIITNAAREGARIAVLPGTTDSMVTTRVKTYMSDGQLSDYNAATVAITRDATIAMGANTATASKITISYPFTFVVLQPISKLINPSSTLGAPLTMSVSALMRNET